MTSRRCAKVEDERRGGPFGRLRVNRQASADMVIAPVSSLLLLFGLHASYCFQKLQCESFRLRWCRGSRSGGGRIRVGKRGHEEFVRLALNSRRSMCQQQAKIINQLFIQSTGFVGACRDVILPEIDAERAIPFLSDQPVGALEVPLFGQERQDPFLPDGCRPCSVAGVELIDDYARPNRHCDLRLSTGAFRWTE